MTKIHYFTLAFAMFMVAMAIAVQPAFASTNLSAAQSKYKVDDARVIEVYSAGEIKSALATAGDKTTKNARYIVHVNDGVYTMDEKLIVPKDVILVSENNTTYTTNSAITQFFTVRGSLYGGTFDCNNKAPYGLRFADGVSYATVDGDNTQVGNGWMLYATVKNPTKFGIVAFANGTEYCYVYKCNVYNAGKSGIASVEGAWMAVINRCTITGSKESGISLSNSNINIIKNCTIKNNGGHGISTDVEEKYKSIYKPFCKINKIMGNIITNNEVNGVYIDEKCKVTTVFSRNIINNNKSGLSIDAGAQVGTTSKKASAIVVAKNTVTDNKVSNLSIKGKGAVANLGKENDFSRGGVNNLTINNGATAIVSGNKNKFNNAKSIGIAVLGGSTFEMRAGTRHEVQGNGGFGVKIDGKSSATLLNVKFANNKGFATRVSSGCTLNSYKGCNLKTATNAANRLYYEQGATVIKA